MSIISISLDTNTRQVAMTVDGIIVPAEEVSLYKYQAYDGEGYDVGFSYTEKRAGKDGLVETHSFRLAPPVTEDADANAVANAQGLIAEVGDSSVARQIAEFLKGGKQGDMPMTDEEMMKKKMKMKDKQGNC